MVKLFHGIYSLEFSKEGATRKAAPRGLTKRQQLALKVAEEIARKALKKGGSGSQTLVPVASPQPRKDEVVVLPQICAIVNEHGESIPIPEDYHIVIEDTLDKWCCSLEDGMREAV